MRFLRIIVVVGVLLVGGIVFLVGGIKDKVNYGSRMDISEVTANDLKDGMFIEGTIYEIWDKFAYETNDSSTYDYYAVPLETSFTLEYPVFVAVKVTNSSDKSVASRMSKETDDFYLRDIEPAQWTEMPITGRVDKLDGKMLDYLEEYAEEMEFSRNESVAPYVITRYVGGNENVRIVIGAVMTGVGLLILGLFAFFVIVKGRR